MLTLGSIINGSILAWPVCDFSASNQYCKLGVILPPDFIGQKNQLGMKPIDSAVKNRFGDRECLHDNFNGVLTYAPKGYSTDVPWTNDFDHTYLTPPYSYVRTTHHCIKDNPAGDTVWCTNWIYFGVDGSIPLFYQVNTSSSYRPSGSKQWTTIDWYWKQSTLHVVVTSRWWRTASGVKTDSYSIYRYAFNFANASFSNNVLGNIGFYRKSITQKNSWPLNPEMIPLETTGLYARRTAGWWDDLPEESIDLPALAEKFHRSLPVTDINMFGDLCRTAINDAHVIDINSIAYLKELLEIKDSFLSLYKLLKGNIDAKALAQLFLSFKYGLRLSALDTKEIASAAANSLRDKTTYRYRYVRSEEHKSSICKKGILKGYPVDSYYFYKIYYDPVDSKVLDVYRQMADLDLFPSLQNIWDLIPFSFVVDWFTNLDKLFDTIDARTYTSSLSVHSVIRTVKHVIPSIPSSQLNQYDAAGIGNLSGAFSYTFYERMITDKLDLPRVRLDIPQDFSNFAELTAIIVSRIR